MNFTSVPLAITLFIFFSGLNLSLASSIKDQDTVSVENALLDSLGDFEPDFSLYPDLSLAQSNLAHLALKQAYGGNLARARKSLVNLKAMELERKLPPLSFLLTLAIDVMHYQNGDYANSEEEKKLLQSIDASAKESEAICKRYLDKDPRHPTYLLIRGGIRGFLATLKIHSNPSQAMSDGFQALKLLEKSREEDPRLRDSYMGTGIFNCTVANAPLFVRATLKIFGRSASMKAGLEGLRVSAYLGQYTTIASQLFLIQFLSPYEEELKREKRTLFKTLEKAYPHYGYYTFLKNDEALSFYPDSFYTSKNRSALRRRIAAFSTQDYASERYANLVRYQYTLLDSTPDKHYAPDSSFDFRDYNFYPVLIGGLHFKHLTEDTLAEKANPSPLAINTLKIWRDSCLKIVEKGPMNPTRKRFFKWHIHDALTWKEN